MVDQEGGDRDGDQRDERELGVEREEDDHHRHGYDCCKGRFRNPVRDEVFDRFDVVDGSRDQAARALIAEEAVG